jgi:hypothetical protein
MFWIEAAWNYLFGWAGVDFLIGCAFVALAILVPPGVAALVPDLRKTAVAVAVVAFTCMGCIAYGHKNAIDFMLVRLDEANRHEAVKGEADRVDAERTVGPVGTDRRVFDNDPDNRVGKRAR